MKNKATIMPGTHRNGKWKDMEKTKAVAVVAHSGGKWAPVLQATFWKSRSRALKGDVPVYCTVWGRGCSGHGYAKGYGYHKESTAFGTALESAGIKLDKSIDGVGDCAMEEACYAYGAALGYRRDDLCVMYM